jgi:hypothetical protein
LPRLLEIIRLWKIFIIKEFADEIEKAFDLFLHSLVSGQVLIVSLAVATPAVPDWPMTWC